MESVCIQTLHPMCPGLDRQRTAIRHGIDGIQNNVKKHLRKLRVIAFDHWQIVLQV